MQGHLKVAILGTGKVGTDLLIKILRSEKLECRVFIGRNIDSPGLLRARQLGVPVSIAGIDHIVNDRDCCDLVFDATSARAHEHHARVLNGLGKITINLTPAGIGAMCVPAINLNKCLQYTNVNMMTCGGQASIPIAYAIGKTQQDVDYIEVVSSIASRSAGPATRLNLDEYIHTTEASVKYFSGARRCKAILNLNPAVPRINMQTTILARVGRPDIEKLHQELASVLGEVTAYVHGYELVVGPVIEDSRILITVRVKGTGDHLPGYAGNLDIINCAAIATAEAFAEDRLNPGLLAQGLIVNEQNFNQRPYSPGW